MLRSAFRFLLGVTALVLALGFEEADAQACCAGAAAGQLGRLTLHEEALVGLGFRAERTLGAFGDDATFRATEAEAFQFEQSLLGTLRVGQALQLGAVIPLVQSYARTTWEQGFGGGLGDIQLHARYDFTFAGQSLRIPGIALFGGLGLPTGRPLESTMHPLGVEATGTGRMRAWGGLGLEQSHGMAFGQIMGSLIYDGPRSAKGMEFEGRWGASASLSLGASLPADFTVALSAVYEVEPRSERRGWRYGVAAGYPVFIDWRLQAGLFTDAPIDGFGRNQNAQIGLHLALLRIWS